MAQKVLDIYSKQSYNKIMKYAKQRDMRFKTSIPMSEDEIQKLDSYLKSTGRKAGPWLRVLILQAIEQDKALMSGMSQVDMDFIERAKQAKREGRAQ